MNKLALTILCFLVCIIITLVMLYINQIQRRKCIQNDIAKLIIAIKRVRYGNINVRLENLHNKELETTINRLFETINDREVMIKEYQLTLSNKNLTLEEIIQQEKQLKELKDEFIATLTHDMKVPVIAELNSLNYLLDGRFGILNKKQVSVLKLMKNSNQELKELIENLLEVYKIEQKSPVLNLSSNNFNELIKSSLNEMQPIINNSNKNIIMNIEPTKDLKCYFDFFQLKRVIKNLVHNALTYSAKESEIIIKTELSDKFAEFYITNKGNCISEEDLNLIFQKYYSGNSKLKKSGTGLGLYISQQIILAHGGEIKVKCTDNIYTTFILTLPVDIKENN